MITEIQQKLKLYLASASPRRKAILAPHFPQLEVLTVHTDAEEPNPKKGESIESYMEAVCAFKWSLGTQAVENIKKSDSGNCVLVVADTTVGHGDSILGKPNDSCDARRMLKQLSGSLHRVYSAYRWGLFQAQGERPFVLEKESFKLCWTDVHFKELSEKEITDYIATGESMDKAGSYGYQGEARCFVEKIDGYESTIVGFPLEDFLAELGSLKG